MKPTDCTDRYCIIGAGSSGLTVAKNLRQFQIPFNVIEREDDIGGNWYYGKPCSSVTTTTHFATSKLMTEYPDFAMPETYPDHPHHSQVLEYLRAYVQTFSLYALITFNASVEKVEAIDSFWDVTMDSGKTHRYRGVIIANGHRWDPKIPLYPGHFVGTALHSKDCKTSEAFYGKHVLVVGGGASGQNMAIEAAQHATRTFHSTLTGYVERQKLWGNALLFTDDSEKFAAIRTAQNTIRVVRKTVDTYTECGMITPKPEIEELRGNRILFVDGTEEMMDVIIYATGYKISFPFFDKKYFNFRKSHLHCYLNIFHPTYDTLFFAGLINCYQGEWRLVDYQAQLIAAYLHGLNSGPGKAELFRQLVASEQLDLIERLDTTSSCMQKIDVEYFSYQSKIERAIGYLGQSLFGPIGPESHVLSLRQSGGTLPHKKPNPPIMLR